MNKQLQNFFDNTKQLHILLCIALLLIIILIVAPIGYGVITFSGQMIIIVLLAYILYKNFTETHNFVLVQKKMEKDRKKSKNEDLTDEVMLDIKNNTIASYVLCVFILLLLLYVIYSLF